MLKIKKEFDKPSVKFDPAPSRVGYFFYRIWLRKSFRLSLFIILPTLTIFTFLFSVDKKYDLDVLFRENKEKFLKIVAFSPAFKVVDLSIISDDPNVVKKIKTILDLTFPLSSLDINVVALKTKIEKINLVRSASVRLTSSGAIEVTVTTRKPIAIQRLNGKFLLLDASGVEVDQVSFRSERIDLPLLVGRGAETKVEEALNLILETKSLMTRVRGLIRIGERRWDVILDRNQIIKLPEENPVNAMKKVVALHEGRRLLDRDLLYLDLRNVDRPTLGLTDETSKELRAIRRLARGEKA